MADTNLKNHRITSDTKIGKQAEIHGFVNLYGCKIGDGTRIGCFVEIQKHAVIGSNCKISSHSFICEGVTLEDGVFIGHGVIFSNDKYPRATRSDGNLANSEDWECQRTLVKRGASIGSGTILLGGLVIGENAMIGAGSVVTADVPPHTTVAGNPARFLSEGKEARAE